MRNLKSLQTGGMPSDKNQILNIAKEIQSQVQNGVQSIQDVIFEMLEGGEDANSVGMALMQLGYEQEDVVSLFEQIAQSQQPQQEQQQMQQMQQQQQMQQSNEQQMMQEQPVARMGIQKKGSFRDWYKQLGGGTHNTHYAQSGAELASNIVMSNPTIIAMNQEIEKYNKLCARGDCSKGKYKQIINQLTKDRDFIAEQLKKQETNVSNVSNNVQPIQKPYKPEPSYRVSDLFEEKGLDPSFNSRSNAANAFGMEDYKGTAEQNLELIKLMRNYNPMIRAQGGYEVPGQEYMDMEAYGNTLSNMGIVGDTYNELYGAADERNTQAFNDAMNFAEDLSTSNLVNKGSMGIQPSTGYEGPAPQKIKNNKIKNPFTVTVQGVNILNNLISDEGNPNDFYNDLIADNIYMPAVNKLSRGKDDVNTGKDFSGQRVPYIGFGQQGMEMNIDNLSSLANDYVDKIEMTNPFMSQFGQRKYGGHVKPFSKKKSLRKKRGGQIAKVGTEVLKKLMAKGAKFDTL